MFLRSMSRHFAAAASGVSRRGTTVSPHFMPFYNRRFFSDVNNNEKNLDMVTKLEEAGVPRDKAKAIINVINYNLKYGVEAFDTKSNMHMREAIHQSQFMIFKTICENSQKDAVSFCEKELEKNNDQMDKSEMEIRLLIDDGVAKLSTRVKASKSGTIKYFTGCIVAIAVTATITAVHFL